MAKSPFPKSMRKNIRLQKARIRREVLGIKKQKELIDKLYTELLPKAKEEKEKPASSAGTPERRKEKATVAKEKVKKAPEKKTKVVKAPKKK
ncbi:MAG: hypothetical protein O3C23_01520 [bacterium]|nr:hypothetical protein [bacterium]